MEINQLKYFITTAHLEHITKASYALNITQSALSRVILRMENELGVNLFDRKGPIIALNDYGRALLYHAQRIISELTDLNAHMKDLKNGSSGTVNIGIAYPTTDDDWLASVITDYMNRTPEVSVHLFHMNSQQIRAALNDRQIDVGITTLPLSSHSTVWKELFAEEMGVIMSRRNPLTARQSLSVFDLRDEHFLCNGANSDQINLTRDFCERSGFTPDIRYTGDYPHMIANLISLNKGIAFITADAYTHLSSESPLEPEKRRMIEFRLLTGEPCVRHCGIAYPKNRYVTQACEDLISAIVDRNP